MLDELPTHLPELPAGVTFDVFQDSGTGFRYWQFTDAAVTGGTFLVREGRGSGAVSDALHAMRVRFQRTGAGGAR